MKALFIATACGNERDIKSAGPQSPRTVCHVSENKVTQEYSNLVILLENVSVFSPASSQWKLFIFSLVLFSVKQKFGLKIKTEV